MKGDPEKAVQRPGPFFREALRWWGSQCAAGKSGLCFLPPLQKESGREWKFFLQLRGSNVLRHAHGCMRIPPGWMGLLPAQDGVEERWEKDKQERYAHLFYGVHPGRMAANFVGQGSREIRTAISLPFTRNTLLEQMCLFAAGSPEVAPHHCQVIADLLLDGMRVAANANSSRLTNKAMKIVLDRPCSPELSVKWIAQQLNCHPDYLSRRFQLDTGTPLMTYVRNRRMEIAADLLRTQQHSVAEVAADCGYRDHSYFTRIFHQTYGVVPSQWGEK